MLEPTCSNTVTLRPARQMDSRILQDWLEEPGGECLECNDANEMLQYYLRHKNKARAYIVVVGGVNAGIITINLEDGKISIDHILIQAALRSRGYCSRAVKCLVKITDLPQDIPIQVGISINNEASIGCFRSAGFIEISRDEYQNIPHGRSRGNVRMEYHRPS